MTREGNSSLRSALGAGTTVTVDWHLRDGTG